MSELKPCPFCGGKAESMVDGKWYYIFCGSCHSRTVEFKEYWQAGQAWNNRYPEIPSTL